MTIATPKVTLIASTLIHDVTYSIPDRKFKFGGMELDEGTHGPDDLAEFAGRACYQSFHKPNPATASNKDYLANILRQAHESVLEHASATFYITGISRALTHELIRHRHLSYSELSQRFVNVEDAAIVIPPAAREVPDAEGQLGFVHPYNQAAYRIVVDDLTQAGLPRKQAREAARAAMPNMLETRIVVTGNMRAWRDVVKKRYTDAADAEIREVAGMILDELRKIAPNSFQDIPEAPQ